MPPQLLNTRILVIDDKEMVRDNIRQILQPEQTTEDTELSAAASLLFDEPATNGAVLQKKSKRSVS